MVDEVKHTISDMVVDNPGAQVLVKPAAGQEVVVETGENSEYLLDFELVDVQVSGTGSEQFSLVFSDQSRITFTRLAGYAEDEEPRLISGDDKIAFSDLFDLLAQLNDGDVIETAAGTGDGLSASGGGGSVYDDDLGKTLDGLDSSSTLEDETAFLFNLLEADQPEASILDEASSDAVLPANQGISAITDSDLTANSLREDAAEGDAVYITAFANDPDGEEVTYSLADNANGFFAIDPVTGVVTLTSTGASGLDYETATSHDITVVATSSDGTTTSQIFTVSVTDQICEFKFPETTNLIEGDGRNNTLRGTDGSDEIRGHAGNDHILAGDGDDLIIGGTGNDTLRGEAGNDVFLIEGKDQGADRFIGGDGTDHIHGGDGDDVITVSHLTKGDSIEEIDGCEGTNVLSGTSGNNTIDLSNTTLKNIGRIDGGAGNDSITGSAGDDTIVGGTGNDNLRGGDGDDTFIVEGNGQGADRYNGGAGRDKIQGTDGDQTVVVSHLTAGDSIEEIDLGSGINVLSGTSGNNTIDLSNTTLTNVARIEGGAGNDSITGSAGDDTIVGGTGNDNLRGG
ncbi:calcium-binding protein, partial [Kiloniella laminariae]|uniref:calcium-binding protein n=1 Tax=Kiloniella laminariae TaxID=454162 RepID=UPI000376583D